MYENEMYRNKLKNKGMKKQFIFRVFSLSFQTYRVEKQYQQYDSYYYPEYNEYDDELIFQEYRLGEILDEFEINNINQYCDEYGIKKQFHKQIMEIIKKQQEINVYYLFNQEQTHFNLYYAKKYIKTNLEKDQFIYISPQTWVQLCFKNIDFKNYQKALLLRPYGNFLIYMDDYKYFQEEYGEQLYNDQKRFLVRVIQTQKILFQFNWLIGVDKNSLICVNNPINLFPITSNSKYQYDILYNLKKNQFIYKDKQGKSCYGKQLNRNYQQWFQDITNKYNGINNQSICLYGHIALICDDLAYLNKYIKDIKNRFSFYPFVFRSQSDSQISFYYDQKERRYINFYLINIKSFQQEQLQQNQFSIYCQNIEACKNLFYKNKILRQCSNEQCLLTSKIKNMYNILGSNYDIYCFSEADWIQQMIISDKDYFQIDNQTNKIMFKGKYQVIYQGNNQQMAQINDINYDDLSLVMFINLNKFKIIDWKAYNTGEFIGDGEWLESIGIDEKKRQLFESLFLMYGAIIVELELKCNQQHIIIVLNYPSMRQDMQPINYLLTKYVEHKLQQFNKNNYPVIFCGDQNTCPYQINNMLLYSDNIVAFDGQYQQNIQKQKYKIGYKNLFNLNSLLSFTYLKNYLKLKSYYNSVYEHFEKQQWNQVKEYKNDFQEIKFEQLNVLFHELKFTNVTKQFRDTLDYIFYSQNQQKLKPINFEQNMKKIHSIMNKISDKDYLPNKECFSDHIPIYATFQLD